MKPGIQKRFTFIGKSMLWSLLLYVTVMLFLNWDEVSNTVNGNTRITVVNSNLPELQIPAIDSPAVSQTNVAGHAGVAKNFIVIIKTICGIAYNASGH